MAPLPAAAVAVLETNAAVLSFSPDSSASHEVRGAFLEMPPAALCSASAAVLRETYRAEAETYSQSHIHTTEDNLQETQHEQNSK
jgi:hypothetical protein